MTPDEKARDIARALGGAVRNGAEWYCRCPAHNDHQPSLSITEKDGRLLFICRAGCDQSAVLAELKRRNLWPEPVPAQGSRIVAIYNYRDEAGVLRYQVVRQFPKKFFQRHPNGSPRTFINNMRGIAPLPYRLPELLADPEATVFIAEGEKDCDNLGDRMLVATCNHGGAGKWRSEISRWLAGRHVVILPDNDEAGLAHARDVAQKLAGVAASIRILDLPGLAPKGDVSDWLAAGGSVEALEELAKGAPEHPAPKANGHDRTSTDIPAYTGKDFSMQKIEWLWPGWLAAGKLHLLAGAKGAGKSTLAFDLMARISIGGQWPDGSPAPLGDVLIWSAEDGIEDTILPRFYAAGGDLGRVYPIKDILIGGQTRRFDPSTDIPALIEMATRLPALRLAVIDPIVLAIPSGSDSHKNTETRRGLQPLVNFAEQRGIALLGITHFTKGTADRDPIERVTGSLAFGALPRCVWGASASEDGFQRRLVRIASNIGPSGGGFEYTMHQEPLHGYDFSAQRVDWGVKLNGSPSELLNHQKQSARADAVAFLRDFLQGGSCPQREIKDAAEAHGHSWRTVERAKIELGVKVRKAGKAWHWELPEKVAV